MIFLLPMLRPRMAFCQISFWEHNKVPWGTNRKAQALPGNFNSQATHFTASNLSNLPFKCSTSSTPNKMTLAALLCLDLSLQISEWQFALWPQFSDASKKSHWFSVCSAFFLLCEVERWLLSCTHVGAKTESQQTFSIGSNSKYFWLCKIHSHYFAAQDCISSVKAATDSTQMNGHGYGPIKLYLHK